MLSLVWSQAFLSFTISQNLLKLISIELVMTSNHLIFYHPLLLLPSIFPNVRVFPVSWLFTSGEQRFGVSASASGLPVNIQGWFPLRLIGLIFALPGTLENLLHQNLKRSILQHSAFIIVHLSYLYTWLLEKPYLWPYGPFVSKVMYLLFNMLSSFVIAFISRSKCLSISWLQSPSAVTLEPKKIKSARASTFSPSVCHEVMGPVAMILVLWMVSFKPAFSLSSFTLIERLFNSSSLSAIRVVSFAYIRLLIPYT